MMPIAVARPWNLFQEPRYRLPATFPFLPGVPLNGTPSSPVRSPVRAWFWPSGAGRAGFERTASPGSAAAADAADLIPAEVLRGRIAADFTVVAGGADFGMLMVDALTVRAAESLTAYRDFTVTGLCGWLGGGA